MWDEKSDTNILQILIRAIYGLRQEIQPEAGGKEFLQAAECKNWLSRKKTPSPSPDWHSPAVGWTQNYSIPCSSSPGDSPQAGFAMGWNCSCWVDFSEDPAHFKVFFSLLRQLTGTQSSSAGSPHSAAIQHSWIIVWNRKGKPGKCPWGMQGSLGLPPTNMTFPCPMASKCEKLQFSDFWAVSPQYPTLRRCYCPSQAIKWELSVNPWPLHDAGVTPALHACECWFIGVFPAGRFSVEKEWGSLCTNIFGVLSTAKKQIQL